MTHKLADQAVQTSIHDFLSEAHFCAEQGKGFACMATVFTVILSLSEAVIQGQRPTDTELIAEFVAQMNDKSSWLVAPTTSPTDAEISDKLTTLRNGLTHALSMPPDVVLEDTMAKAVKRKNDHPQKYRNTYIISTLDFVRMVKATAADITARYPNVTFDPDKHGADRGPAYGFTDE